MTIRAKILATLSAMTVAMLLVGTVGGVLLWQRAATLQGRVSRSAAYAEQAIRAEELVRRVHDDIVAALLAGEGRDPRALARLDERARTFYQTIDRLDPGHPMQRAAQERLRQAFMSYYLFAKQMLAQGDLDRLARNGEVLQHFELRRTRLQAVIDSFEYGAVHAMQGAATDAGDDVRRSTVLALSLIAMAVLATAVVSGVLSRSLAAPVRELVRFVQNIRTSDDPASAPVRGGDEVGSLALAFNQMKRRLAENERELAGRRSLALMGRLSGAVSHEMNNVLGAIAACLGPASEGDGGTLQPDAVQSIRRLCRQGGQFTAQLARVAGRPADGPQVTNVDHLSQDFFSLAPRLLPSTVTLRAEIEPNLPPVACAPSNLHAILLNLLLNSVDAMPEGGIIRIVASLTEAEDGGRAVAFRVCDTGVGIPTGDLGKVFDPHYSTKSDGERRGLGLAVVRSIVEEANGRIAAASGGGETVFTVTLPVVPAEETAPDGPRDGLGLSALLVTSDQAVVRACAPLLKGKGFEVLEARAASAALGLLPSRQGAIGLFVVDRVAVDVPPEALHKLLALYFERAPVLYLDGSGSFDRSTDGPTRVVDRRFAASALAELLG